MPDPSPPPELVLDEPPCMDCGAAVRDWTADDEVWAAVMGPFVSSDDAWNAGDICPSCFFKRADAKDIRVEASRWWCENCDGPRPAATTAALSDEGGCVGCERYRAGIAQITDEYEAELARREAQLTEAWGDATTSDEGRLRVEIQRLATKWSGDPSWGNTRAFGQALAAVLADSTHSGPAEGGREDG